LVKASPEGLASLPAAAIESAIRVIRIGTILPPVCGNRDQVRLPSMRNLDRIGVFVPAQSWRQG